MVASYYILRGLGDADDAPTITERTDPDFLPAILDDIKSRGLDAMLGDSRTTGKNPDGSLKLWQPVQRTFHVALFEAACDPFGQPELRPRLDPQKIESAGIVVRRLDTAAGQQGWRSGQAADGRPVMGWMPFPDAGESLTLDPDPARRPVASVGHPEIDRMLAELAQRSALVQAVAKPAIDYQEIVAPLFVAPPDVCAAAGKTLLYGLVPVTSSDISTDPPQADPIPDNVIDRLIPLYLKAGGPYGIPSAGQKIGSSAAGKIGADAPGTMDSAATGSIADVPGFVAVLRLLRVVFNLFGETPESQALYAEINKIGLPMPGGAPVYPAADFFRDAADVLAAPPDPAKAAGTITMPLNFPKVDANQAATIRTLIGQAVNANLKTMTAGQGRYQAPEGRYVLRGFIRIRDEEGCPPILQFSSDSPAFTIAPWYEGSHLPPVTVSLPDLMDPNVLKRMKPNVAFEMPESLFGLMQGVTLKGLSDGTPSSGSGLGIGWLCSFSIPFITICAFIVLNIFLQLLNIVFQWLLFIKICLPYPKPRSS